MELSAKNHRVWIYLRVSRVSQDEQVQRQSINEYAERSGICITDCLADKISGTTPWRSRSLARLENQIAVGDCLIVSELSRIGRNTADVLDFLAWATSRGLIVIVAKGALQIDSSIQSKIFTTIMALASEIERDFMSQRTKEGLAVARAAGKQIGRPHGKAKNHRLDDFKADIETALSFGVSKAYLARIHKCSRGTIERAIAVWKNQQKTAQFSKSS